MKIIFSRKGFDSAAGGVPSPIVAGRPVSLPIPTKMPSPLQFADLAGDVPALVADLTKGKVAPGRNCHLDPDIDPTHCSRQSGWRGALGQDGAAQGHLAKQQVQPGDLFLFWGLFRPVDKLAGKWTTRAPLSTAYSVGFMLERSARWAPTAVMCCGNSLGSTSTRTCVVDGDPTTRSTSPQSSLRFSRVTSLATDSLRWVAG